MELQRIDLFSAIIALSGALDLVGIDEVRHGKRVAMMARNFAKALGWPEHEALSMLYAGMLHDCGVSKTEEHRHLTAELEWDGAEEHCIRGAGYLAACPVLAHLAEEIRYHHTRWDKLRGMDMDERTRQRANLIFLADRIDVLQAPFLGSGQILVQYQAIIKRIEGLAGSLFSPELVAAFAQVANVEAFWLEMEPEYLDEDLRTLGARIESIELDHSALKEVARLFSHVVDAKSPYTDEHSQCVAKVARQLASDFGIAGSDLEEVEIAGLLHDIGKLRISEDIIDKPGSLTPEERACIHRHSYDTFRILQRVFGDSKIPVWAGFHHENLRGEGYPFKSPGNTLDLETRIIAVADVFQALAQNRPYRASRGLDDILADLRRRVAANELDDAVVAKLAEQAESYYRLATGGNTPFPPQAQAGGLQ